MPYGAGYADSTRHHLGRRREPGVRDGNTTPVLRHGLHRGPGEREFLTARVSVPDLTVRPSHRT
ncbi:hypothetical protein AV521_14565 [Streptomyces sp. IMTB 2501]|nr:hypothetical protein AV521_14565 [Streptomyces sp. IMTB 2501]